jgi:integrase/recombinase XerD
VKTNKDYFTHFELFLLTEKRVAKNTLVAYRKDVSQFLLYITDQKQTLKNCSNGHLKKFLQNLKNNGITAKSLARKISALKLFFSFLNSRFEMENKASSLISPKIEKTLPICLTEDEIKLLFDAAGKDNSHRGIRNKVMLSLLYAAGMRVSEMVNMTVEQIHFDTGFVNIIGKGDKERMVPITQNVVDLLRTYLDVVYDKLIPAELAQEKKKYLFPIAYKKKLKPISRQQFWSILKNIIVEAGIIKNVSPHSLRHSLATHLLKKGANIRLLQVLLGHEQLTTVQIYTHLENNQLKQVYDKKHPRA